LVYVFRSLFRYLLIYFSGSLCRSFVPSFLLSYIWMCGSSLINLVRYGFRYSMIYLVSFFLYLFSCFFLCYIFIGLFRSSVIMSCSLHVVMYGCISLFR